jgi:beta-glucosidase
VISVPESVICSDDHAATARAGAAQGSTLLKNEKQTLPLKTSLGSVAVVGPNGDLSKAIAGYYGAGDACSKKFSTMVDAVTAYVPKTTFAKGILHGVLSNDTSGIANATAAAKAADATVMVLGTDLSTAHEGHDATDLSFSAAQLQLGP